MPSQLQESVEMELHVKEYLSDNNTEAWSNFPDSLNAQLHNATIKKNQPKCSNFSFPYWSVPLASLRVTNMPQAFISVQY